MSETGKSTEVERFPRLRKIAAAIGLAAFGPATLYGVLEATIAGEIRNKWGGVIASAKDDVFEFYLLILIGGAAALFITVLGALFLFLLYKGRSRRV